MAIEKRLNKVWNGTSWVEIYNPTSADLVYMADSKTVEQTVAGIKQDITNLGLDIAGVGTDLATHEAKIGNNAGDHKTASDISKLGFLADNANATYATKAEVSGVRNNYVEETIAERDLLTTSKGLGLEQAGDTCWVVNATGDSTVTAGAALYVWSGNAWQKIAEAESLDVECTWAHVQNKPAWVTEDLTQVAADSHTHANKGTIDLFAHVGNVLSWNGDRIGGNVITMTASAGPAPSNPHVGDVWLQEV